MLDVTGGSLPGSLQASLTDFTMIRTRYRCTKNANANTMSNVAIETEPAIMILLIGLDFGLVGGGIGWREGGGVLLIWVWFRRCWYLREEWQSAPRAIGRRRGEARWIKWVVYNSSVSSDFGLGHGHGDRILKSGSAGGGA